MNAALLILTLLPGADPSPEFARDVQPFLVKHCYSCHDAKKARAGFRIDQLGTDFLAGKTADVWKEVIDQINSGAMPPKSEPRPDPKQSFAVVEWVGRELKRAEREARIAGGRNLLRRLNRDEYANTVVDLLGLDPGMAASIRNMLPADGTSDGFDRVAASLYLDQTLMESYLDVAKLISDRAIFDKPTATKKLVWEPQKSINFGGDKHVQADISKDIVLKSGALSGERRKDGILTWNSGFGRPEPDNDPDKFYSSGNGPRPELSKTVTTDGYYRIRFVAGASPGDRGLPIRMKLSYAPGSPVAAEHIIKEVKGTIDQPVTHEVVMFLRAPGPDQTVPLIWEWNAPKIIMTNPAHTEAWMGLQRATNKVTKARKDGENEATLAKLEAERQAAYKALATFDQPVYQIIPGKSIEKAPKLFLGRFEIEGPLQEWPPRSHATLGLTDSLPQTPAGLRAVFERLLPRAYRRPVTKDEVDRVVGLATRAMSEKKASFHEAVRIGLQLVLVSPGFIYLSEPEPKGTPRPLTDHELASRLSYFLWASLPDDELFQLAAAGKLRDMKVLDAQVTRMLRDPKSRRFVESFAGQWLDVRQYGTVMPAQEYRTYDKALEVASKEEPLAFFEHILRENLPITNFLDSDFLVINERLAKHYGIDGVKGPEFRKVAIRPEHHRGGVLGMAGLLTLLSDGNRTLPVRRAAWVLEKLLNDPPPPPPPNAGDIQPNTSGKNLSVRQRLALHRNEPTCASCHAKLDPYGLSLENYDAIGAWREKQNGEGIRGVQAPKIDPSGELKSGRKFATLEQYKAALLAEKDKFSRAFAEEMLTYALCRPVGYVDRATVDELTAAMTKNDDRIQTLIRAIVASDVFRTK
jgi:hypothetical protein